MDNSMKNESTKTGLIGFFDILGYQNLLERNEPETIAEEVLPVLTNIGKSVTQGLKIFQKIPIPSDNRKHLKGIIKAMRWLVFSDTVLLTLPMDEADFNVIQMSWLIFLTAVIGLQSKLFRAGLPVRGAIEYGKFFVKDTCFAGRTIVTAYQLCSQLELAACVFSEVAANEVRRLREYDSLFCDSFLAEYLIPTKSGEKHLLAVMAHTYDHDSPDIHGEVMSSFWGNKKDVSLSARQKAQNTEQWLEFLKMKDKQLNAGS